MLSGQSAHVALPKPSRSPQVDGDGPGQCWNMRSRPLVAAVLLLFAALARSHGQVRSLAFGVLSHKTREWSPSFLYVSPAAAPVLRLVIRLTMVVP